MGTVALREHRNLLLDVLDLILCLFQVDDLHGHHLLGAVVDSVGGREGGREGGKEGGREGELK